MKHIYPREEKGFSLGTVLYSTLLCDTERLKVKSRPCRIKLSVELSHCKLAGSGQS